MREKVNLTRVFLLSFVRSSGSRRRKNSALDLESPLLSLSPIPPLLPAANITLAEAQNALASLPTAIAASVAAAAAAAAAQQASAQPAPSVGLLSSIPGAASGAALLRAEARSSAQSPRIITFCAALDRLLGGGIARGQLTEVCGPPGVGKTQLALQAALDAAIPRAFGGAGGEALIVDSEGSVLPERAAAMAQALSRHLRRVVSRAEAAAEAAAAVARSAQTAEAAAAAAAAAADAAAKCADADASGSASALLSSVRVLRVRDAAELSAAVAALPLLAERHPRLALVAVDSVAFVWRASAWSAGLAAASSSSSSSASAATAAAGAAGAAGAAALSSSSSSSSASSAAQTASRARALASLAASLSSLARERGLAVLLTNQVTTRPAAPADRGASRHRAGRHQPPAASSPPPSVLVPALGDSWGHVPTTRLMLSWASSWPSSTSSSSTSTSSSSSSRQRRVAELVKSPSLPPGRAEFEVTGEGIRGPRSSGGGGGRGGGAAAAATAGAKRPLAA